MVIRKKSILIITILLLQLVGKGQTKDSTRFDLFQREVKSSGISFGIHQFQYSFFELGFSRIKYRYAKCAFSAYYKGQSLGVEYNPFKNKMGFCYTRFLSWFTVFVTGVTVNVYSDFTRYEPGIRPFIGVGPGPFYISYGYNFVVKQNEVNQINTHCFSLKWNVEL